MGREGKGWEGKGWVGMGWDGGYRFGSCVHASARARVMRTFNAPAPAGDAILCRSVCAALSVSYRPHARSRGHAVQMLARHWQFVDATARASEVKGPGTPTQALHGCMCARRRPVVQSMCGQALAASPPCFVLVDSHSLLAALSAPPARPPAAADRSAHRTVAQLSHSGPTDLWRRTAPARGAGWISAHGWEPRRRAVEVRKRHVARDTERQKWAHLSRRWRCTSCVCVGSHSRPGRQ